MNLQATLNKHKSKEGWLEKKSPRILVGFQKRYFTIGEDNDQLFLLYDKTLPQRDKKPKGAIMISLIEQIVTKEDSKEFILKFGERDFILRAANVQLKKEWIATINFLKEYSISKSSSSDDLTQSGKTWRFEKLDANRQRNLRLNQEKKNQDEEEVKKIEVKDEEMQKIKGIFPYFEKYSEDVLQNHIVQGFMYKKKEKFGNKVVQPKLRWFFIFSKYNLCENISNTNDFDLDDLPPFINPNVLYYYDARYDDSKIEGEIHVKNIISIKKIDLKVDKDNILKKGIGAVGNQIISAVNKFTEITKLDKIGAHIHQFEFIFQVVAKKGTKEITHNFYSESLLQIEKWVNSLQKIKDVYEQEHIEIEKQNCTNESTSPHRSPDVSHATQEQEETSSPEIKMTACPNDNEDTSSSSNNLKNHTDEAKLWRSQIIFQQAIKTKVRNKLKIGWKDKIMVVKRQIIQIFNDEQDLNNGEQEDYILIKDIEKISQEKNPVKFRIETKKNEQRSFKLKNEQQRTQWMAAIQKLMQDEDTPLEELRQSAASTSPTRETSAPSVVAKKVDGKNISINDCKSDVEGEKMTESQSQSRKSGNSFKSIDDVLYKGYQATKQSNQAKRKLTFFQKIFGCCIDPRQEDIENANDNEGGRSQLQRKLIS